ncbi:peptidoglycan-binding protein [Paraburkholderia lycopersici]|uniref:Peptidoglycan L-alanyl-D-glutamate endopeptidase CwlK n=1 Tax=Paraburkholderia lycopersici TaxID=416944 RepID=A0A1G6PZJ4_9BURK|nr:peptidoglycan-binding protein [Paraburkholderia lycopersici]SDC85499.1 peptidoglycan L-alanyl-D-glutamate endopeptidase CwlK [Paraburkholderia lycopersici]
MIAGPLKQGDSSDDVKTLQQALTAHGFSPGVVDGQFGQGTVAAVMAFQKSEGLLPDGIAGPRTLCALDLANSDASPSAIPAVTVQVVSQMFPVTPIGNIKANLPSVLSALIQSRISDKPMVLMALATVRAEVECFEPIAEGQSRFNTSPNGHAFDLYDNRKDLGNRGAPDGASFKGRGYVQLTGRLNYQTYGPKLATPVDLVNDPDRASDPVVAAELLALFLADRELAIKKALLAGNMATARQLVNGGSNGLDRFADAYQRGATLIPNLAAD